MNILDTLRGPTVNGIVLFDTISTYIAAYIITGIYGYNFIIVLTILFIISIILHYIFSIDTQTNYLLGLSNKPRATSSTGTFYE